jgi:hypothetical protein
MDQITFDARDETIRQELLTHWQAKSGMRVGDYIQMLDGSLRRFTHDWGKDIQTTMLDNHGSFYFAGWYCSYSGGLDRSIPKTKIVATDQQRDGEVWFFHHGRSGAHRGVYCSIPCRVYRQIA